MNRLFKLLLACVAIAGTLAPLAATAQVNVNLPWVRATAQKSAAVFMQLEAHAGSDVVLTGATSPLAQSVKIMETRKLKSGTRTRETPRLTVAAGASLVLKPGAQHLLLLGVAQPLIKGEHVPLTLNFEVPGAPPLMIEVNAEIVGAHDLTAVDHEKHHHQH